MQEKLGKIETTVLIFTTFINLLIWKVEIISLAIFPFIVIKDPYYYMLLE